VVVIAESSSALLPAAPDPLRVDRWLWAARLFKTRSLASKAAAGGQVKIDDVVVKPARLVRPGDSIDAVTPGGRRVVEVVALSDKRGSATQAQALYIDHTPPEDPAAKADRVAGRDRGAGRPSKRERRRLIRFRERS
jgi:ribosome-associated heat shock protein Hsp15